MSAISCQLLAQRAYVVLLYFECVICAVREADQNQENKTLYNFH